MNNKGQVYFYAFMIGIVVIVLALALAFPVKQSIDTTRSDMNCSNPSDNYYRAACIVSDITTPYFILGLFAIGGAVIGAKLLFF